MTSPPPTGKAAGRRRPAMRWIVRGVLFVALAAGVFGLLPRLAGLTHDAAGLLVGAHPGIAERAARRAASWARHIRRSIDPEKVAQTSGRLVRLARSALTGRAFAEATVSHRPTCSSTCSRST